MAEEKPLLTRCGEKFSQMELLSLIKGAFDKIENFGPKMKEIVQAEIGSTPRKEFCQKASAAIQPMLVASDGLKQKITADFDPSFGITDQILLQLPKLLTLLLDNQGSDAQLITNLGVWGQKAVLDIHDEIIDGFETQADFVECIKEFATILIKAACEPAKAGLASMFGVPPIIKYVESVLAANRETSGNVEMKQAEETKAEMATETLAQRYARILAGDKAQMTQVKHKPLSRAYVSLDLGQNASTTDE